MWMYGDTDLGYISEEMYNGEKMFAIENGLEATTHGVNANTGFTQESYIWTKKVNSFIGLQYIHDYIFAYPNGNALNYNNASKSWIFIQNNDNQNTLFEWIIDRYGDYSDGNFAARNINTS